MTAAHQADLEKAVRLIMNSLGQTVNYREALHDAVASVCQEDANGERDMEWAFCQLHNALNALEDAAYGLYSDYADARLDHQDSLSPRNGAGHGGVSSSPPSALPSAVADHARRSVDLERGNPLVILGQGEYAREMGGES